MRNANKILVGKPEVKRPLGRAGHIRENNIRMEFVYWVYLSQDRDQWRDLTDMVMNLRVYIKSSEGFFD
jgi:hypothetical protein